MNATARKCVNHLCVALVFLCLAIPTQARDRAQRLFEQTETQVYQVRVIDIASGDKYSIGSGFLVGDAGQMATNFHVVSSYVHEPDKYRLEYVAHDGSEGELALAGIDVIHDLAVLYLPVDTPDYLALSQGELRNGDRLYSMGNPLDLGMTIIEGTYNGLVENSRYRKILFSGSLNSGMSGGPALNERGEVIGVNVSKGGEQISFLVPVAHLEALLGRTDEPVDPASLRAQITATLTADQASFYRGILEAPPATRALGELSVPDKLHESLRCWGHTVDETDQYYQAVHQHCRSEDDIYISNNLYVGEFQYDYEFIESDGLNRFQFYTLLQDRFTHMSFSNTDDAEEVSEFTCHADVVGLPSGKWKISSCLRSYHKHEGLYDASMTMASLDHNLKAAIIQVGAGGISLDNALAVFRRMTESVTWTP